MYIPNPWGFRPEYCFMCSLYKLAYVKHVVWPVGGGGGQDGFLFVCNTLTVQSYCPFLYCNHLAQDFTFDYVTCIVVSPARSIESWFVDGAFPCVPGRLEMY